MKSLTRIAAAAVLVVGSLTAGQVMAAEICNNCAYTGDTYLGMHNGLTFDTSGFRHNGIGVGAFSDTWIFDFTPASNGEVNANFIPSTSITGFVVNLRDANGTPGVCGATGASCVGTSLGAIISAGVTTATNSILSWNNLAAGRYAIQVFGTGTSSAGNGQYSGQVALAVPEPSSLALVGLGLIGAAVGLRRTRKA